MRNRFHLLLCVMTSVHTSCLHLRIFVVDQVKVELLLKHSNQLCFLSRAEYTMLMSRRINNCGINCRKTVCLLKLQTVKSIEWRMETDRENFIVWRVEGLCWIHYFFCIGLYSIFTSFSSFNIIFILFLFGLFLILFHTHEHTRTYSLCDKFDMIFHSGRRLGLMWSWASEFPSNEFFYYASLFHPLQGYSLAAMWSSVNTKLLREKERERMHGCIW